MNCLMCGLEIDGELLNVCMLLRDTELLNACVRDT